MNQFFLHSSNVCSRFLARCLIVAVFTILSDGVKADTSSVTMPYCEKNFVQTKRTQSGFDFKNFDCGVAPQQDFYQHVNRGWIKNTPIPLDKTSIGTLDMMTERNDQLMRDRLKALMTSQKDFYPEGSGPMKVVTLYQQGLDLPTIEKSSPSVLQDMSRNMNDEVNSFDELMMNNAHALGMAPLPFKVSVGVNVFKPRENAVIIEPGTLLLDDRDVLMGKDKRSVQIQNAFMKKVQQYLLFGQPAAKDVVKRSKMLLVLNQAMAKRMLPKEEIDQHKIYKNYSIKSIQTFVPLVNWKKYCQHMGLTTVTDDTALVVQDDQYLKHILPLMQQIDLQILKDYQWVSIMDEYAWTLSKNVRDASFAYDKVVMGLDQPPQREQAVLDGLSMSGMAQAVGRIYIDSQFSDEANQEAQDMVKDVIAAFRSRLAKRTWLNEETRQKALQKVDAMTVRVGAPKKWIDFSTLAIHSEPDASFFLNMGMVSRWHKKRQLAKFGEPVDLEEWEYPFNVVNAYYDPSENSISFPASIMQPPFFSADSDPALNYGGIGTVIGHEITHGFDAMGSAYGATGELKEWWTPQDRQKFDKLNQKVVDQYNHFEVLPGVKVNGKLTIGEDLADFGGITAGYEGLMARLQRHGGVDPMIDGLTQSQRFYITAARNWRENVRPNYVKMMVSVDPHPPGVARGTIPLINTQAFQESFKTLPKDRMYLPPEKRVEIW